MTVIHRYITRLFFKYLALVLVAVVTLYLCVDFFARIDKFMVREIDPIKIVFYFIYKIPLIISQITPAGILLAVLSVFGLMGRNNEIIALKSGGVSPFYLLRPVIVIGIVLTLFLFVFSEIIVPVTTARANRIAMGEKKQKRALESMQNNIWIRQKNGIVHVKYVSPTDRSLLGVTLYDFDSSFNLVRRVDARSATWEKNGWVFSNALVQSFDHAGKGGKTGFFDQKRIYLDILPDEFKPVVKDTDEMSFASLRNYIRRMEADGYDATHYRVDLDAKLAFPFVCLIMCLMGSGISLAGKAVDGMAASFGYGIVMAAIYWSAYSFCLSLGYGGVLPPVIAAWTVNILFFCAAAILILRLE
ncbi:MAG: LPS export ABC transporter permease LptG [Deltaproteobacteria bacterium]|nr:LPS export ABC transporter permease LptG [Deltaproteobacteria bacterium]